MRPVYASRSQTKRLRHAPRAPARGALFAAVLAVAFPGLGAAPGPADPLSLRYEAPASCGSASEIRARLAKALGRRPTTALAAEIEVRGEPPALELTYEAHSGDGISRRTLHVESCEAAVEAAVLMLMLTIDPALAVGAETPTTQAQPVEEPTQPVPATVEAQPETASPIASPEAEPPTVVVVTPARDFRPRLQLEAMAQVTWGFSPALTAGPRLNAALTFGPVRLSAGAEWHPTRSSPLTEVSGARLDAGLARAQGDVAWLGRSGAARVGPFVGLGVARLRMDARGISDPQGGSTQWLYVPVGVLLDWKWSDHWGLSARVAATLGLEQPNFVIDGLQNPAHQPETLGLATALGINFQWGSQK